MTRRLVLFEAASARATLDGLARAFPGSRFELQRRWELPGGAMGEGEAVSLLFWDGSFDDYCARAGELLRGFVYPLVVSDRPCCLAFPFPRELISRQELDLERIGQLDLEDTGALLFADSPVTSLALLGQLRERIVLTPIERRLADALERAGIGAQPQVRFGPYRLDFLVSRHGRRLGVEADGRGFHDAERDRERDRALVELGLEGVLRFTGSEIHRDASACAAAVERALGEAPPARDVPRLERLDPSQERAVEHGAGPARVLAPAGAGKTRTLVQRVVRLVERGVDPTSILVLAFNRKAAEQLVARIGEAGVATSPRRLFDPERPGVVCATFNAFGYRYQRELLGLRPRLETDPAIWRRLMQGAIRESGVKLKGSSRGSDPVGEFLKTLDRVRSDLVPAHSLTVEIERAKAEPELVEFGPVWQAFERRRLETQIQSFDDQVATAVTDLLQSPERRRQLQAHFQHVLVDEFQDLNAAQLALVDILSRPWRNLYVVGDDDQLIYGWRGAEVGTILDFPERMPAEPHTTSFVLETNYRCSRALVEASRRLIDHNQRRVAKAIRPREGAPEGFVRFLRAGSARERSDAACAFLELERARPGRRWRDLAVLCRYKAQQPLIAMALDRAGIPRSALLSYRLFTDPQMRLLRDYLTLMRDPSSLQGPALAALLNRPNRYLKQDLVNDVSGSAAPWQLLEELCDPKEQTPGEPGAPQRLHQLVGRVRALHARHGEGREDSAGALLERVVEEFELEGYWRDASRPSALADQGDAGPLVLLDIIRSLAADVPDADAFLADWDRREREEASRLEIGEDELAREEPEQQDQVVINTLHAAKGREYEAVVIFDYRSELGRSSEDDEEERRVFYVGLTRARDAVLVTLDADAESLHPFVRETLRAVKKGEREALRRELLELRAKREEATVELARAEQEIERIRSGETLAGAEQALAETRAGCVRLAHELAALETRLAAGGLRATLKRAASRGQISRRTRLETKLAGEKKRADQLERETLLLHADPELAAASFSDQAKTASSELERLSRAEASRSARLEELDLLGAEAGP